MRKDDPKPLDDMWLYSRNEMRAMGRECLITGIVVGIALGFALNSLLHWGLS